MAPGVFVMGALHLDVVMDSPHLPALDETLVGSAVAYRFGGKGGNQAVAAARMGAQVAMAGRVGRDRFGEMLLAAIDAAGVDRSGASGMSVAIVDAQADYGAVIVSGVNQEIGDVAVPAGTRIVVLQNEVPEAANLAVAEAAGDALLVLNAAPAREVAPRLLARTDVLVVNRGEAAAMAGVADPEAAAIALRARRPGAAIVTLGAAGLVAATADGVVRMPAWPVAALSSRGAGDAFTGALAAELAHAAPLAEALRFAPAAAALTVATRPDDRDGVRERKVRTFLSAL